MSAIVPVSERFSDLVDPDARPQRVAGGLVFTEGPVWDPRDSSLTFSDIPADTLYRWSEADRLTVLRRPSGQANGNTRDGEGRLLTCEHANRRVSRTSAEGHIETVASHFEGKRLNSPNDLVVARNGDIYFTDPPYGLRQADGSFAPQEVPFNGVYRWSARDRAVHLLDDSFVRPNGLVLSDDGRSLFVADTQEGHVRVIELTGDGAAAGVRLFTRTEHREEQARPDGMKMDARGNLYVTSSRASGVWVYDPSGSLLGQIGVGENPANCAFGGPDWTTLFVTAQTSVYRVELRVRGQPVGRS